MFAWHPNFWEECQKIRVSSISVYFFVSLFVSKIKTVINFLTKQYLKLREPRLERHHKEPHKIQQEQLINLISKAKNTQWGRKHNFKSIKNQVDFRKNIEVQTYETLKEFIFLMMNGKADILWPGHINWYAKSSGTTGDKSKFIPVSLESLYKCHYRGGKDVLATYCKNNPNTKIFEGKSLVLGGSHKVNQYNKNVRFGDLSAVQIENLSPVVEFYRTPSKEIILMDNWDLKLEKIADVTINVNVTNISGVPSWMLVLLRKVLEKTGKSHITEVWPNLEVFMHGAVNFSPYREQYQQIIPNKDFHYLETYNASEGFFALQDTPNSDEMMLMLDYGVYYEFLPMSELNSPNPITLTLEEVELDVNYAMLISTASGLWRYLIGDTVKFTSKHPYRIKITGRTKHFINAFGEELIIENAESALQYACSLTQAQIIDYTAAPIYISNNESGAHQWLIEFAKEPENLNLFAYYLDEKLKENNSDYEAKRFNNYTLRMPVVQSLPRGTFENWLKLNDKLGGQNKVPRLSNDRKIAEQVLDLIR